jgi:hypothetical protein
MSKGEEMKHKPQIGDRYFVENKSEISLLKDRQVLEITEVEPLNGADMYYFDVIMGEDHTWSQNIDFFDSKIFNVNWIDPSEYPEYYL